MTLAVILRQVPNVVEELAIAPSGRELDRDTVSYVVNEYDEHALEEALLLGESTGEAVVALGVDTTGEFDQVLYTALAKGAQRGIKLVGDFEGQWLHTRTLASLLAPIVQELSPRLVLTGVQTPHDLDGQLTPVIAALLGWPHVSVVVGAEFTDSTVRVRKELWGGMNLDLEIKTPAVLGIQTARRTPRYVPVARVRQVMREARLEETDVELPMEQMTLQPRLRLPEAVKEVELLQGSADEIAERLLAILRAHGLW